MSGQVCLHFRAAAPAASSLPREHEHHIGAGVDELLGSHAVVVYCLAHLGYVALHAFVPVMGLGQVRELARSSPLDLGIE